MRTAGNENWKLMASIRGGDSRIDYKHLALVTLKKQRYIHTTGFSTEVNKLIAANNCC